MKTANTIVPRLINVLLTMIMTLSIQGLAAAQDIKLIVRGDDFGMTQGSLIAFERAFNQGVLTCGSLLVPAPWFEAAAALCRKNPTWCIGVHLSLVGEWVGYRWRPVMPWDKVSSIVDEDGYLYTYPKELFRRNPRIEEIEAELRAQVNLAIKKGIDIQYIDTHYMSMRDYPGLSHVIKRIGRDFNLPISGQLGERRVKDVFRVPVEQKKDKALEMLEKLQPGLWLWLCHIGIESPEQNALVHSAAEDRFTDEGVGRHRAAELNVVTSPEVRSVILSRGIELTNYRELGKEK